METTKELKTILVDGIPCPTVSTRISIDAIRLELKKSLPNASDKEIRDRAQAKTFQTVRGHWRRIERQEQNKI